MKIKKIARLLALSMLGVGGRTIGWTQELLVRVHHAELFSETFSLSCFTSGYAAVRLWNDFGTREMVFAEAGWVAAVRKNRMFLSINHYGYANYGELNMSVGYGRNFGDRFAMTARVFYMMAHARGYPLRHSLCTDFAVACKATAKLVFDASVYNPFMMRYGVVGQDVVPLRFTAGCMYSPLRKLLFSFRMSKTFPGTWEAGCRFMVRPASPFLLAVDCTNSHLGTQLFWIYGNMLFSVQASWYYRIMVSPRLEIGFSPEKWIEGP